MTGTGGGQPVHRRRPDGGIEAPRSIGTISQRHRSQLPRIHAWRIRLSQDRPFRKSDCSRNPTFERRPPSPAGRPRVHEARVSIGVIRPSASASKRDENTLVMCLMSRLPARAAPTTNCAPTFRGIDHRRPGWTDMGAGTGANQCRASTVRRGCRGTSQTSLQTRCQQQGTLQDARSSASTAFGSNATTDASAFLSSAAN